MLAEFKKLLLQIIRSPDIIRYERQLQYNYGLDEELTMQTIELWAGALKVELDYEFLNGKENIGKLDQDIYNRYKAKGNVY